MSKPLDNNAYKLATAELSKLTGQASQVINNQDQKTQPLIESFKQLSEDFIKLSKQLFDLRAEIGAEPNNHPSAYRKVGATGPEPKIASEEVPTAEPPSLG